jgi:hypothetical protein
MSDPLADCCSSWHGLVVKIEKSYGQIEDRFEAVEVKVNRSGALLSG